MSEDLQALAATLDLKPEQQAAFDAALEQMKQRQAERMAQAQSNQSGQQGGNRLFGGGPGGRPRMSSGGDASMQAQMRARMRDRFNQQFAAFTATLDDTQKGKWNAALDAQLNAKRVTVYKLGADGKVAAVLAKLGASDGSNTEVSGRDIAEGDKIISGERAATGTK